MNYFDDLGFFGDDVQLGGSLVRRTRLWTLSCYLLLCLGIFLRQVTKFPRVDLDFANIRISVAVASLIIGLAIFPPVIRWLNRRRKHPGVEHALLPFSIGFFVDLSSATLSNFVKLFH